MGLSLLSLTKSKTKSDREFKTHYLFDQDTLLNTFLKRYEIKDYLLFIKKEDCYVLATQRGYSSSDVDTIKFNEQNLLIDFLTTSDTIQTREELDAYYRESIFIPKEMNLTLKMEKELLQTVNITNLVPFFNEQNVLFGFLLFRGNFSYNNHTEQVEFYNALKSWALTYYMLHIEHQSKQKTDLHSGYIRFTTQLSSCKHSEEAAEVVLGYLMELMRSTKGIYYTLQKGYYTPMKFQGITFIRSYSRTAFSHLKNTSYINIQTAKDPFFEEIGKGHARVFYLNHRNIVIIKQLLSPVNNEDLYEAVQQLSGKLITCLSPK